MQVATNKNSEISAAFGHPVESSSKMIKFHKYYPWATD
jgi:hypothetical protein